jgi:hypothetical protein
VQWVEDKGGQVQFDGLTVLGCRPVGERSYAEKWAERRVVRLKEEFAALSSSPKARAKARSRSASCASAIVADRSMVLFPSTFVTSSGIMARISHSSSCGCSMD